MKRIALLHYAAPPTVGGVESTIANHARLMADRGYAVKVIAGRGEVFDARVPVVVLPLVGSRHPDVLKVQDELARGVVSACWRALVAEIGGALTEALADCDLCIAHNVTSLHKNLALTAALKEIADTGRLRLIAWCHDLAWLDPLYRPILHEGWPWDLLRMVWPNTRYVAVSQLRQKELATLLGITASDIAVIKPGMDVAEFLGIGERAARWADELNLWDAHLLMLLPARVTRRKNIELGIEITAALRQHGLKPKLVVMGPLGPHNPSNVAYLEKLHALSQERGVAQAVIFLQEYGRVSDATRRDLYLLADLLLLPSQREGFGIPVLEGALAKLPIFCSDIPPFRESAGDWAHYFDLDESPAAIANRIAAFLAQDPVYQLRRRVLPEYRWQRIFAEEIDPLLQ
jgi:glycosyltransferase involved in cell wall biosynthesis